MIYLVGGAPRVGKSILAQQLAAQLKIGWISTDLLLDLLRAHGVAGIKAEWNATPEAIRANATWFAPSFERFMWGISSMAEHYLVEGVDFLPEQVTQLATKYPIRSVFLGCSTMTQQRFEQFPGHSPGYGNLPLPMRLQIVQDVPLWSAFIRQECERYGVPYLDTSSDFQQRLAEAAATLTHSGV